jgi:PAP2 superfamily
MNGARVRARLVLTITAIFTVVALQMSPPASADEVPDQVLAWNQHAYTELILTAGQPPPVAMMHFAMVHGAVYDAVNAIDGGYDPYLGAPTADGNESIDAAAAAAAYEMLLYLLPETRDAALAGYYTGSLALVPDGEAQDDGVAIGQAAAAAMIASPHGDGRFGDPSFTVDPTPEPGDWVPLAASTAGNNLRWVGDVTPFLIPSAAQFRSNGPKALSSAVYAAEFDQVKALGRATDSTRTPDQTAQARFWSDNTTAMWTRIFRQLSAANDLSTVQNARYFAMLYLTSSDAGISCFAAKEHWNFWRPQQAIREAGSDGNPATIADPTWTSLLQNPPYPDEPSGHNCLSSSIVQTLRDFYGTNRMSFNATHSTLGISRSFNSFSQAIGEIRWARVYSGIHFMTADAHGATLGRQVADYRQEHYFQPV